MAHSTSKGAHPAALRIIPQIHRATHRIGLRIGSDLGVTQAEAHVLQHLACSGDCTVGDLHRAFAHRRSTLTSVLDRLVEKGWVDRATAKSDRRTFMVRLTVEGRTAAMKVHAGLEGWERQVLKRVSQRDWKGLIAVMDALEDVLAEPSED